MQRIREGNSACGAKYVREYHSTFLFSRLEYLKTDPDLANCWHFAKLDRRSRALIEIGENAISLVNSFPATAPENRAEAILVSKYVFELFAPNL